MTSSFPKNSWRSVSMYNNTINALKENISIAPSEAASELDNRKKIKYGNSAQAAWGIISEYFNYSTIHGLRYLGEKRPILEKLFWAAVFLLSIVTCGHLTHNIWVKWDQNPVIVSFAEKSTPVWQIPFPSVTICPETKARQPLFNFTEMFWTILDGTLNETTDEQKFNMEAVSQVCDLHLISDSKFGNKIVNNTIIKVLERTAVEFNETFLSCKWRNTMDKTCESMFKKVITEDGICYTFNAIDASETYRNESIHDDYIFSVDFDKRSNWSLEDGYSQNAGTETFPQRVLGAGARAGLFVLVKGMESDYDHICRGPVQGFKVLLTTPGEIPQVSRQYFRVPFGQEVLISIKPNIITTSDGLKDYSPERRQCYFQKERFLRYFQVYTQANCELECLANYTLKACGCVKFSMPRNDSTPICGALSIECYNAAEDNLIAMEFKQGLQTSTLNYRGETHCNCLPACTSIAYEAEISQADFHFLKLFQSFRDNDLDKNPGTQMGRLSIFFKENQFLTSKRSELYGMTDFLASCGGLLGLFMGVSTLSIVELLYFCTVRLMSNLKMRHEKRKQLANIHMVQNAPEIVVGEAENPKDA